MNDTVKVYASIRTDKIGSECADEFDTGLTHEEWNALGNEARDEIVREFIFQFIEWDYRVIEDA